MVGLPASNLVGRPTTVVDMSTTPGSPVEAPEYELHADLGTVPEPLRSQLRQVADTVDLSDSAPIVTESTLPAD